MKGTYRVYVRRILTPENWDLVASAADADEAWAMAQHWEETTYVVAVRVDLCVRYFDRKSHSSIPTNEGDPS